MTIKLLNRVTGLLLTLDPDSKKNFAALSGKVLCIEVTRPAVTVYLQPSPAGLHLSRECVRAADVTVRGSAFALAATRAPDRIQARDEIQVQGDAQLGQSFQQALAHIDVDSEAILAYAVGDHAARKAHNILRHCAMRLAEAGNHARTNIAEYWQEEKCLLVSEVASERFTQQLATLRADVDRLSQRVQRLESS